MAIPSYSRAALAIIIALGTNSIVEPSHGMLHKTPAFSKNYDWITCEEYLDHIAHISAAVGQPDPRDSALGGRSKNLCKTIFELAKKEDAVDAIVNMGEFIRGRNVEDIRSSDMVPDLSRRRRERLLSLSTSTCSFSFGWGTPGTGSSASAISACPNHHVNGTCPLMDPCINDWLQSNVGTDNTDPFETFEEFLPDYPSGGIYGIYTSPLTVGEETAPAVWNGCERDRTDAVPVAEALEALHVAKHLVVGIDALCDVRMGPFSLTFFFHFTN